MATETPTLHGFCDPAFAAVGTEFRKNFAERGELGASVAVYVRGTPVVDMWAGIADQATGRPWVTDTMVSVFSCTKGLAAVCMHMLADQGLLDMEAPVALYWPEFAAHGKEKITVAMVMSHQAGLPFWEEPLPPGELMNSVSAANRLAQQHPVWEPGSAHGYHGSTIGYLEDAVFRRISAQSIAHFFRDMVATPLGADAWIGVPDAQDHRCATVYMSSPDTSSPMFKKFSEDPDWVGAKLVTNSGGWNAPEGINGRPRRGADSPSGAAMTNARGLARIYAPLSLDGAIDGVRLVQPQSLAAMRSARSASSCDLMLRIPTTFTLGFSKCWGDRRLGPGEHVIIGEHAFGAPGLGGNMGFADGEAAMSFGYTMNRHGGGTGLNDRGQSLIDAAYRSLGYTSSAPGFWMR